MNWMVYYHAFIRKTKVSYIFSCLDLLLYYWCMDMNMAPHFQNHFYRSQNSPFFSRSVNIYLRKDCLSLPAFTAGNNHFHIDIPVYRIATLKRSFNCRWFYETIFYKTIFYKTIFYKTLFYTTIFFKTIFYKTLFYKTIFYKTIFYKTIFYKIYFIKPYFIKPYFIKPYFIKPYFIKPYFIKPYFIKPYFIKPYFYKTLFSDTFY